MRRAATPTLLLAALAAGSAILAGAACERQASAGADGAALQEAAPDTLPQRFARNLVGTVGDERVDVWLRREGHVLSGTWLVEDDVEKWMSGTIEPNGAVRVPVYVETENEPEATLDGALVMTADGLSLTGRLVEADGDTLPVSLGEERIALAEGIRLEPVEWIDEDAEMGWSVAIEIPTAVSADGTPLPPAYQAFNRVADSLARAAAEPFRREVLTWEAPLDEGGASSHESGYEVSLAENGLVSMGFGASEYYAGTAHPNHKTWSFTWDFESGRRVELADLFRPGTPYLQTIADAAIPEVVKELGPEMADRSWIEEGAAPDPDNYASWTLSREGLEIVFDPYQVAAYAAGPQVVVVRWSALEPLLDPAGPVARISR